MRKIFNLFVAALAGLAFTGCLKEEGAFEASRPVTISVNIPEDGLTKVRMEQDTDPDGAVKLSWQSTDVITVKNAANEALSVDFTYQAGAGTKTAQFTAASGISALAGATSYNIYLSSNMPGEGYKNQTQASDGSTAHLGYSARLSGVNTFDEATFSQDWATAHGNGTFTSSSVLRVRAQLPTAAMADAVRKVVIKSSAPIFDGDDEIAVAITTPGVEGEGKVVTVYATLPAGDVVIPVNTELLFQFQVSENVNDKYTAYRKLAAATTIHAGQVNSFKINCPGIATSAGTSDNGTEEHPYLIGDRHQMDKMRDLLVENQRKYFKMVDDVDLAGLNWEPVSQNADAQADFNGGGHTIYNLTIDATSASYTYVGFFGLLYGNVHDVMFEGANVNGGTKLSAFVVGRTGASSFAADFSNVTVRNSTLTASNNYVGGICGYVKKSNGFSKCQVIDCAISNTLTGAANLVGALVGWMGPNGGCTLTDCFAERVTVNGGVTNTNQSGIGGLIGRIEGGNVVLTRCHSSGTIASANANNVGGLVGDILSGTGIQIKNCYSTAEIKKGYTNVGGLVGRIKPETGVTIDHCYASGNLELKGGYGGKGGLVGIILSQNVTVKESIAWNGKISAGHATNDAGTGAVVGVAWPTCTLTKNYRKPGITYNGLYWTPSESWDHADVSGTNKLVVLDTGDPVESKAYNTTATSITLDGNSQPAGQYNWAYHGHRISNGAVVSPDNTYGWVSDKQVGDIEIPTDTDPENPSYTGNNVWGLGTTVDIVDGVQWTNYHGTWESQIREINIITTTLNEHNKLGIYYNYTDNGKKYLDEKCVFVNAVAGTNGSMTSQFIRVNNSIKRPGDDTGGDWLHNCALTIDGEAVDIVKVLNNADAATLPNNTVSCAGPLLVWKGNKLTAPAEWLAADTGKWLTTGGNAGGQPRTAIGINKEGTKIIQVTVDGRWTSGTDDRKAYGMATDLLAELMLQLGCYKAMNLDGGGGSQMWVYGKGDVHNIVNHPHNSWPTYEGESGTYYWIKNNEVARRTSCSAIYIYSDLK